MNMTFENKRLSIILITVMVFLLIPFIAMQFTNEVNWGFFDFVIAGVLLLGTGLACELVLRMIRNPWYRIGILATVLIALALIWIELAVGIFGTPFAGN